MNQLEQAARALIERWDTPLWKDVPATAGYINALRDALEQHPACNEDEPVAFEYFKDWMVREMPPMTTIGNPEWWAKRIYERFIDTHPARNSTLEKWANTPELVETGNMFQKGYEAARDWVRMQLSIGEKK